MRPIDADALISFIDMGHLRNPLEACYSERDVVDMLESRPTITLDDLRPHGKWERHPDETHFCSNCGRDATYNFDGWEVLGVSCTYCDAKMDQEDAHGQN